jgi:hypothetical protein
LNHRGYPSSLATLRGKLEVLMTLPDNATQWNKFIREEMRLAEWMLPALQAAIREGAWRTAADPVVQIRSAVHRHAIAMRLSNPHKIAAEVEEDEEE